MSNSARYFLLVLLIAVFALVIVLFKPYLTVFVLTVVLGVMFQPVNRWFRKKMPKWLASVLTTALIVVIIAGPVSFILSQVVRQATDVIQSVNIDGAGTMSAINLFEDKIQKIFPTADINLGNYVASALQWLVGNAGKIFGSALSASIALFLSVIGLYYWFKDSEGLIAGIVRTSPLPDADDRKVITTMSAFIHSVITGTLFIAIIQGVIAGVGFLIFGIPNAILWGSVIVIAALVPTIGNAIVFIPMIAYLFITGQTGPAIGLTVWATLAVGLIDNFLGPKLMTRGSQVHPFLVLIGVLGGVQLFGAIGLFAGPLVVATFFALFEIYTGSVKKGG